MRTPLSRLLSSFAYVPTLVLTALNQKTQPLFHFKLASEPEILFDPSMDCLKSLHDSNGNSFPILNSNQPTLTHLIQGSASQSKSFNIHTQPVLPLSVETFSEHEPDPATTRSQNKVHIGRRNQTSQKGSLMETACSRIELRRESLRLTIDFKSSLCG